MSTPNDDRRTLRAEMDERRERGARFSLREIVAAMVPLITQLDQLHASGEKLFVHPGAIDYGPEGAELRIDEARELPEGDHDKACIAPEERSGGGGDARSSVFAVGAILYELATGEPVGPGMKRPSDVSDDLPEQFEVLLGKALVSERQGRPGDLAALAQALHHCAPAASMAPPPADESHLDHDEDFDVDVSMSMLPPAPKEEVAIPTAPSVPAVGAEAQEPPPSGTASGPVSSAGTTQALAQLKASLEADPRSRYVVIKDGMDHGPFTAVELLQQIASSSFRAEHFLRDTLSQEERQLGEWEAFAPFAEHARRNRDVQKERQNLEATVEEEKKKTQNKAFIGAAAFVILAAAGAGLWFKTREDEQVRVGVSGDEAQLIDFDDGLVDGKKPGSPYKGGSYKGSGDSSGVSPPQLGGGMSCEGAKAAYVEDYTKKGVPPDLTAGAYGSVLNRGTYLNSCGVPPSMAVSVCAAVQNGRAVGVTVRTEPSNSQIASCVAGAVRGMSFPSHPRLDIATTHFSAQ